MSTTTSSILPAPVQAHFDRALLSVPYPNLIHGLAAEYRSMPAHGGPIWRGRQYNPLDTAEVPLGNSGLTPPSQSLTAADIDARIEWYGTYVKLNEQPVLQNQDPILNQAVKRLGQSLRETEDKLLRDMLQATATSINASGGGNGDTPTNLAENDIEGIVENLVNNNAWTVTDHIDAEDRIGTAPVRNAFIGMCSSQLIRDLDSLKRFQSTNEYPNYDKRLNSEWGAYRNVRFFVSSQGAVEANASANNADVFSVFICGMEAYGCIEQSLASARFIYRDPMYDGPLAQNATVGYKFASAEVIFHDEWVQKLRVTKRS